MWVNSLIHPELFVLMDPEGALQEAKWSLMSWYQGAMAGIILRIPCHMSERHAIAVPECPFI